jgi:hypothetical protein
MQALLEEAGYSIEMMIPRIIASRKMKLINGLVLGKLEEFLAFQYLIKARPSSVKKRKTIQPY